MEVVRNARRYRDDHHCLPTLSLGLSSVRLIVNKLETQHARATVSDTFRNNREIVKYDSTGNDYDDFPLEPATGRAWNRFVVNLGRAFNKCVPSVTHSNFGILVVATSIFSPRMITYLVIYPLCRLICGTLYPAYASYKAVRTKNLKEYVKWMMYWIVFAIFTFVETITDVFLSWFPFYYEVKIVLVIWLLSPATKGSSILYRKFVHPELCKREQGIDEYIAKAKDHGYHTVLNLGTRGVNYATTVIMQTAIKGGGGLVQQLRKSYSLSDLTECDPRDERSNDEADDVLAEPRVVRRAIKNMYTTRRSASESNSRSPMYFPEVDVDLRSARSSRSDEPDFSHIKSSEDISSGYSSADNSSSLTRTSSLGPAGRVKRPGRTTVTTIKRPQAAEGNEVIIEELHDDDSVYTNMPPLINVTSPLLVSNTNPPFVYQCVGDQIRIVQVLGKLPFDKNVIENNNSAQWDQLDSNGEGLIQGITKKENEDGAIEKFSEENVLNKTSDLITLAPENHVDNKNNLEITDNKNIPLSMEHENRESLNVEKKAHPLDKKADVREDEIIELDTTFNENNSAESDDEASFGTPEDSPKNKRKSPRGKYGKRKAPSPPKVDIFELNSDIGDDRKNIETLIETVSTTSQESLVDFVNKLPNTSFKDTGLHKNLHVVNPIAEKKRRHKTNSPNRVPKANSSGIGKLLQLPSKLAFWHKTDAKNKPDNISTSSGDFSRRSSTVDNSSNEFEDCNDFPAPPSTESDFITEISHLETSEDQLSFRDAADIENEVISQDIIEKSDALKKLIEAKLESHPEYKFIPLSEEIPTTSKSTDV